MVVNKPSIIIYTVHAEPEILREICAGIEEEGVLYEVMDVLDSVELKKLACEAADASILGSGISLAGRHAVMQMRAVPEDRPVFELYNTSLAAYRKLGANSARAIKKLPFKM